MKKRVIVGLGILIGLCLIIFGSLFVKEDLEVSIGDSGTYHILFPVILSVEEEGVQSVEFENTTDQIQLFNFKLFGQQAGSFELVERELGNDTSFIFERFSSELLPLPVTFEFHLNSGIADTTSWNPRIVEHPHHPDFGVDPTVNPWGLIKSKDLQIIKGNVYLSEIVTTSYSKDEQSIIRELDKEIRELKIDGQELTQSFIVWPGKLAESWALHSKEDLFSSENAQKDWIEFSLTNQTSQLNWLTVNGPFTKLPYSIEPGTKMGYGRAMGRFEDDIALSWYEKDGSVFHESMALNSRVNLMAYNNEYGSSRWPTEYTSMWLKNAYGLHAPYVDTRFNEYVAFYLDKLPVIFGEEIDSETMFVPLYADYLLSRVEEKDIIEATEGFLIVDYFDNREDTKITHASLNHELGGLKILLSAYNSTGNDKYLTVANEVTRGIETFGQEDGGWIRENGDLWYQAKPDGTFSGDDYPQLTLVDLLETQAMLDSMNMPRNAYFDRMIDSKLLYLESENVELIEKVTNLLE